MDTNDYLGSFAQENVSFVTRIVRTTSVGDNYWKVMVFVEDSHYVNSSDPDWVLAPGSSTIKCLTVTAEDYAAHTSGLLQSWMYDLFATGFTGDCILVACGSIEDDDTDTFITNMTAAYDLLKPYAYHKTACAANEDDELFTDIAVSLATQCANDKGLLSSAPYLPVSNATPTSDALYAALKTAGKDAFMTFHTDTTRNAALYSLGLAMAELNGSGTCVGNQFDMIASDMITASQGGVNPSTGTKTLMQQAHVQYFKTVGDNSGSVAAVGAESINGDVIAATWLIAYVTYMTKVRVAQLLTTRGFYKSSQSYSYIINTLVSILSTVAASGRLVGLRITAPAYENLPSAEGDEIVITNAWVASYVDVVRKVDITGALYIGTNV